MAEGLLQHLSQGTVEAYSAGSHPKALHAQAVRVTRKRGIDLRGRRAKPLQEFATQHFDFVISLCDRVREVCPEFPGGPQTIHWSIADPALEGAAAFERTASDLEMRIGFLLHVILAKTRRLPAKMTPDVDTVHVRYMVDDVPSAVEFYTTYLGFSSLTSFGQAFAGVKRGNLRLLLSGRSSSAGGLCLMVDNPVQADGTASICSSTISKRR